MPRGSRSGALCIASVCMARDVWVLFGFLCQNMGCGSFLWFVCQRPLSSARHRAVCSLTKCTHIPHRSNIAPTSVFANASATLCFPQVAFDRQSPPTQQPVGAVHNGSPTPASPFHCPPPAPEDAPSALVAEWPREVDAANLDQYYDRSTKASTAAGSPAAPGSWSPLKSTPSMPSNMSVAQLVMPHGAPAPDSAPRGFWLRIWKDRDWPGRFFLKKGKIF